MCSVWSAARPRTSRLPVVCLAVLVLIAIPVRALATESDYSPVLPAVRADVEARTQGNVSTYDLNLALDPAASTISGTERVDFVNDTGEPQETIYFRLYPNADYYGEGGLTIARARVNGQIVSTTLTEEDTVLALPLPAPLADGDHAAIALRLTISVPADSHGSYGIFSHDTQRNMWILADWYPILAGWETGYGWHLDPPSPAGDPTFSDIGIYNLALDLPVGWTPAATGTQTAGKPSGDHTQWSIRTGPVRELTLVIDDDFVAKSKTVDGTKVTMYTDGDGSAADGGAIALNEAAKVLGVYSDAFGRYPYDELDLVDTRMDGALGISWTGLVFLNGDQMLANPFYVQTSPDRLRFAVAHEVGHQWWGAIVGIDSNTYTFLLEGLTNYLAIVGTERTDGKAAAANELRAQCVQPYLTALQQYGDGVANLPGTQPASGPPRGAIIYGKAALGFLAIREEIGDKAFFTAINTWADDNAYGLGTPEELLAAFDTASGKDVGALWTFWFDSADATAADVEALLSS
jgi:aminopeptidase N